MKPRMKMKKRRQWASGLMAALLIAAAAMQPVTAFASEAETMAGAEQAGADATPVSETGTLEAVTVTETTAGAEDTGAFAQGSKDEAALAVPGTTTLAAADETEALPVQEADPSGEEAEESSANKTRGPDEGETTEAEAATAEPSEAEESATEESVMEEETEEGTIEETAETDGESTEEATRVYDFDSFDFDSFALLEADKEEILAYIAYLNGDESDAFYKFVSELSEEEYILVWIAQYGPKEDVISSTYGFDYDAAEDLEVYEYIEALSEDEKADFIQSLTFEQYKRYLSILEMAAEIEEKDFSSVIEEEEFTPDRTWDYASFDAFAEALTGVSLQRTEQSIQFFNTYVDQANVQAGVTTIDGLLDSNADWYSNDYILSLNPQQFKETAPVYRGSDGNYYAVSSVPVLNGTEAADYQPATSFYNDSRAAEAFTDITYLGNGVYRIPESRYKYCFLEQYVSDAGNLYGVLFGLRIQVLYGYNPEEASLTVTADVVYPDMTERFLPATLDLLAGTASVRVFHDAYDDMLDRYCISASVNRGQRLPESLAITDGGKCLQFVMGDNRAVGSLDILIGYRATSKYSMAAETNTAALYRADSLGNGISLTAEMYRDSRVKLDAGSVPADLAVGDKFVYPNTRVTVTGVNHTQDQSGTVHVGASAIPTHDAQSFCLYTAGNAEQCSAIRSWFVNSLNDANSADTDAAVPGSMVQMTVENMNKRAASNGTSINLGGNRIFGYLSEALGTATSASGKRLDLEGTQVLMSCMHAWYTESTTPSEIVSSVNTFAERSGAQSVYANDEGYGNYHPNLALQCTSISDGGDGYTYVTFKAVSSMLGVRGVANPQNYQCAFATLRIAYENPKIGSAYVQKTSADEAISANNSCYSFNGIRYTLYTDSACTNAAATLTLQSDGTSDPAELEVGTYYAKETFVPSGSGFAVSDTVYPVTVKAGETAAIKAADVPMNDPMGIVINKISSDGSISADLSGAEYTIRYYAGQYTIKTLPAEATTTWVIKTTKRSDGSYYASLRDDCIVSGSAVYGKNAAGTYIIPLGTITVQETKAPAGFTLDGATISSAKTGETLSGNRGVYLFNLVDTNSMVYLKSGNALSTSLEDETAVTLRWAEAKENGRLQLTKTGADASGRQTVLAGAVFGIYTSKEAAKAGTMENQSTAAAVITTGTDGVAQTPELAAGSYWVKELQAPDGYRLDSTVYGGDGGYLVGGTEPVITVPVKANVPNKGTLSVRKSDALTGALLSGVQYTVYRDEGCTSEAGIITVTDGTGQIELEYGSYYVKETGAPAGYQTDRTVYGPFVVGGPKRDLEVPLTNTPVTVEISKTDIATGEEIAGAALQIFNQDGELVAEWTTDGTPHRIERLPVGEYTLVETQAPTEDGYVKAEAVLFTVEETGEIQTVEMKDDYTKVEISKTDIATGEEIAGAALQIFNQDGELVAEWTTDGTPHRIEHLPVGEYTLVETQAPTEDGYVKAEAVPFTVEETGEIQTVEMKDDYTKVEISKTDIATGEEIMGATLQILDHNGELVAEWTTDGTPHRIERLPVGEYTLVETQAPTEDGYVKAEAVPFTVEETGEIQTVEMKDDYTKVEIRKTDIATGEEITGATLQILDHDGELVAEWTTDGTPHRIERLQVGEYTLVETQVPTQDGYVKAEAVPFTVQETGGIQTVEMKDDFTKVEIRKTDIATGEEITGATLQILNHDGELVAEWTTDGTPHRIERLPVGEYTLVEKQAPTENGYVKAEAVPFTVQETGGIQKVEMKDDFTKVEIRKTDAETGEPVAGALLSLTDASGKVIAEWTTDTNPYRMDRLPIGTYTLSEVRAPYGQGYATADPVVFEVAGTGKLVTVEMIDRKTTVLISKQDIATEQELPGATITVTEKESGKLIEQFVSGETPHPVSGLVPGRTYILTEVTPPDGYQKTSAIEFTVTDTAKPQKIVMYDAALPPDVNHPKTPDIPPSTPVILGIEDPSMTVGILFLAAGIFAAAAAFVLMKKRKERKGENG